METNPHEPLRTESPVRKNIYIEPSLWELAKRIGNGKASVGIRLALREASKREDTGI